jgi:hypothetical protein
MVQSQPMKESASQNTTAHTKSGAVTCRHNASGWWVYYPALRNGRCVRLRKRFGDQQCARRFADEKKQEIEEHGINLGTLPREVRSAYAQYQELLAMLEAKGQVLPAFDMLVAQALEVARENLQPGESSVAECIERYLKARKSKLSTSAYHSIRLRLRDFAKTFGIESIQAITPQIIEDFLNGLTRKCKGPDGLKAGQTKASADSRNHYRAALVTFFTHAFEHGWADTNPAACVKRATPDRPKAAVLTPQQAETVLRTAATSDPSVLPALALQMFAGLRVVEVPEINFGDLLYRNCEIVQVASSQTGSREIPVCNALREWLQYSPTKSTYAWSGSVPDLRRRLTHLFRAVGCDVGIESPRVSYYRYKLELSKDAAQIATETCAPLARMEVQPGAAETFFKITPNASGECPAGPTSPTSNHE